MNKVIIVGHPSAGLEDIETLLRKNGLRAPFPSRRESLLPVEINSLIRKGHQAPHPSIPTSEAQIQQIQPSPLWQNLIIDLITGNASNSNWGWADSQMIYLLDYWKDLIPESLFVVVYGSPRSTIRGNAAIPHYDDVKPSIQNQLNNWAAFNSTLLSFFLQNPDRCILWNAGDALSNPAPFIHELNLRLANPLGKSDYSAPAELTTQEQLVRDAISLLPDGPDKSLEDLAATATENYIAANHLALHPQYQLLFEELQSSSAHPSESIAHEASQTEKAWEALISQRRIAQKIISHLQAEKVLLQEQIYQVQEELEKLHLKVKAKSKESQSSNNNHNQKKSPKITGAAERVKQQLSYRLGSTLVQKSKSITGLIGIPFFLAAQVSKHNHYKRSDAKRLPPIHTYADAADAERIKQQLSYRLGNIMVKNSGSPLGWLKMPFELRSEVKAFKQEKRKKSKISKSKKP